MSAAFSPSGSRGAMTKSPLPSQHSHGKQVPIQHRAYIQGPEGKIISINGYCANRTLLKQRFTEGGYQIQETPHFFVFTRQEPPTPIVVHWFAPDEIHIDIWNHLFVELKPPGVITSLEDVDDFLRAVVGSLFPHDSQRAWHLFATNTLERYHRFLHVSDSSLLYETSKTISFALLYRRVWKLLVGESLLDAGCSSGFLPLLLAEHASSLTHIVGIDIRPEPFILARTIAQERRLTHLHFLQANLLDKLSGHFDTVTALHVLEHFTEQEMYLVLTNLLKVTTHRLLLAVPYEQELERVYGHQQLFTRPKLEAVGHWCLQQLEGNGRVQYEDCEGGLLLIERYPTRNEVPPEGARTLYSRKHLLPPAGRLR